MLSLQNPSWEKKLNYLRIGVSLLLRDNVHVDSSVVRLFA